MFSVIIPLYNKEISVKNTIQSVLDQTFQEFEIVIVNDGSTDASVAVVESFNDSRIRLIHQKNQGVSAARNKGIEEVKYEWIAFLDADDLWMGNHLITLKNMIVKYPDEKVFTTSFIRSTDKNNGVQDDIIFVIENYFKEAIKNHVTWTSVICINKEVFVKIGVFNENLNRGEDLDLWARVGKEFRYVKTNRITAIYTQDIDGQLSRGRSVYENSILSVINLKGIAGEERSYFKRMVFGRLKSNIRYLHFAEIIKIIKQHKLELFN